MSETDALIQAAEEQMSMYDGDDRQDIKTDVANAFYAGAKWQKAHSVGAEPSEDEQKARRVFKAWAEREWSNTSSIDLVMEIADALSMPRGSDLSKDIVPAIAKLVRIARHSEQLKEPQ